MLDPLFTLSSQNQRLTENTQRSSDAVRTQALKEGKEKGRRGNLDSTEISSDLNQMGEDLLVRWTPTFSVGVEDRPSSRGCGKRRWNRRPRRRRRGGLAGAIGTVCSWKSRSLQTNPTNHPLPKNRLGRLASWMWRSRRHPAQRPLLRRTSLRGRARLLSCRAARCWSSALLERSPLPRSRASLPRWRARPAASRSAPSGSWSRRCRRPHPASTHQQSACAATP